MRLIDADALKDNMRFKGAMSDDNHLLYVPRVDVSKSIDNAPTVNAVPVVRCKDCKYGCPALNGFNEAGFRCTNKHTPGYESCWWFEPDWYCAGGEE